MTIAVVYSIGLMFINIVQYIYISSCFKLRDGISVLAIRNSIPHGLQWRTIISLNARDEK